MSRYFEIGFGDLSYEKQQELIAEISKDLYENYKDEAENGNQFIGNKKNWGRKEYKNMTWQEACCREYAIDFDFWEDESDAKKFNWDQAIKDKSDEEAEKILYKAFKHLEVEVDINI